MSYQAINWAYEQQVSIKLKFVLVTLANFADEEHSCFPSQSKIAAMTEQSQRTVRDQIAQLCDLGLVTVVQRRDPITKRRLSDRYRLAVDGPKEPPTRGKAEDTGHDPTTRVVASNTRRQETSTYRQTAAGIKEPSVRTTSRDISTPLPPKSSIDRAPRVVATDRDFEQVWQAWPKKAGKALARTKFMAAVARDPDPPAFIARVLSFAEAYGRETLAFVPHLSTWLNQERWEDDLENLVATIASKSEPPRSGPLRGQGRPNPTSRAQDLIERGKALDGALVTSQAHPEIEQEPYQWQ